MTDKTQSILNDNIKRKFIFLFPQFLAIFGLYIKSWEITCIATLLAVIFVGILFFRLIDEMNEERKNMLIN